LAAVACLRTDYALRSGLSRSGDRWTAEVSLDLHVSKVIAPALEFVYVMAAGQRVALSQLAERAPTKARPPAVGKLLTAATAILVHYGVFTLAE
jgi:hypothetical protein